MFIYVSKSDFSSGPDGGSPKDGLDVMEFDPATGAFKGIIETIRGLRNPGYLALHPKLPVMYLSERWINEDKSPTTQEQRLRGDCVRTFSIDTKTGKLKEIDRRYPGGESTMHQSVHPSGKFIAFASPGRPVDPNPKEGHLTVLRIGPDGKPGELCASVVYPDPPPVWRKNRPKPYPHSVFPDPKWKRVFSPCLMADRVLIYKFDENTGALTPSDQPYAQTSSNSGPRHMAFHPNGKFFYTTNEFDATLSAFLHDSETGLTSIIQTASFHPAGFEGKKNGSHVVVHPNGRTLYASNRSYQCITVFAIDQATGELTLISHRKTGERPRDFVFDPSGKFLLVTNQNGNTVMSFHVDPLNGDLRSTGHSIETFAPNCVVFGPV